MPQVNGIDCAILDLADRQGWDDETLFRLACQFMDGRDLQGDFLRYLKTTAESWDREDGKAVPAANDAKPRLMATFRPQAWQGGYAVDIDWDHGPAEFDATAAFLALSAEEIRLFEDHSYISDGLAEAAFPGFDEHNGPYEVDVDIDAWLEENGIDGRAAVTEDNLARLRQKYGVTPC